MWTADQVEDSHSYRATFIDSLDGFTFRNQLMSIMLVMATGHHLQKIISYDPHISEPHSVVIWGPPKVSNKYQKILKLNYAFLRAWLIKCDYKDGNHHYFHSSTPTLSVVTI